ncbi:MAG: oxaloacetate decarboxylase subunit alpha [Dehalococcoidia bacterium]|nr:oxaloacetate decarboxylase subunit alpha [Dehalococcoidia bacterium]
MKPKPVRITDTVLRDGHQSLLATRMRTEDMLPIAEKLDSVGYHSLEVWGGATFDTCLRFLNEDPWERLRLLKKHIRKTPLQMLLRGQNVVGYRHYADDIVERFIARAVENGMDIFRIFDALNDVRNLETAMKVTKKLGAHVQATICYTISPVHNNDFFVGMAKQLEDMGADSICIKDMAGLIAPKDAFDLVSKMKASVKAPIQLHCHYTSGMASSAYLKAVEAGVDILDTAISTMALGSSQPPTETLVSMLKGTPYDTGLDLPLLSEIARYFGDVRRKYRDFEGELMGVDTNVLIYQIPGGMISNLVSQLRDQNALGRLDEVLQEVPRVRKDMGYPPLVTPSSQIVGTQAVLNVVTGERYKMVPKEVRTYFQGLYGRPPGKLDPQVKKAILGDEKEIKGRPADSLAPEYPKAVEDTRGVATSEEDVITFALFPQVAMDFFKSRVDGVVLGKDLVAAIAAVLAASAAPAQAPARAAFQSTQSPSPASAGPGPASQAPVPVAPGQGMSPWKLAGRIQSINQRLGV